MLLLVIYVKFLTYLQNKSFKEEAIQGQLGVFIC